MWSYRPWPLPDETLSSYLIRAAHEMCMRPITLLNLCWGTDRSLLNQDLDNYAPDRIVDVIAASTKRSREAIIGMTLAEMEGRLTAGFNIRGRQPWTLPSTVSNNDRRRHGLQFCPACLRTDPKPFFRRTWRLAFATMCTVHGTPLLDACPDCGAVLHPHGGASIVHCAKCGCDLRWNADRRLAGERLAAFQATCQTALACGWAVLDGRPVYSHQYFAVVRQVAALMVNGRHAPALREVAARAFGGSAEPFEKPTARQPIEYLRVHERRRLFSLVAAAMDAWPTNFASMCHAAGVRRSHALKDMADPPFVFEVMTRNFLDAGPYFASEPEVAAAAAWLRKTRGKATYADLKAICGESRAAIYTHMDYERRTARPSAWRVRALSAAPPSAST